MREFGILQQPLTNAKPLQESQFPYLFSKLSQQPKGPNMKFLINKDAKEVQTMCMQDQPRRQEVEEKKKTKHLLLKETKRLLWRNSQISERMCITLWSPRKETSLAFQNLLAITIFQSSSIICKRQGLWSGLPQRKHTLIPEF